jgi:hypothetical protein
VHDDVGVGDEAVDERLVGDRPLDELDLRLDCRQGRAVARIRQGVEDGDLPVRAGLADPQDEVRADEPGAAGDEDLHAMCSLVCG